jgi:hypothetical protein
MKYPKRSQYKYAQTPYRIRDWPEYEAGLQKRSMVENTMYRYKTIIGRSMRSRTFAGQRAEVRLASGILNTMTSFGMPDSYRVA